MLDRTSNAVWYSNWADKRTPLPHFRQQQALGLGASAIRFNVRIRFGDLAGKDSSLIKRLFSNLLGE